MVIVTTQPQALNLDRNYLQIGVDVREVLSAFHRSVRLLTNCRAPQQDLASLPGSTAVAIRSGRISITRWIPIFHEDVEPHLAFRQSLGEHTRGGSERREGLEAALDSGVWATPAI